MEITKLPWELKTYIFVYTFDDKNPNTDKYIFVKMNLEDQRNQNKKFIAYALAVYS